MSGETIYSKAADVIRAQGWFKAGDIPSREAVCIALAVECAASGCLVEERDALASIASHLGLLDGDDGDILWRAIPVWNDAPERTVEDVLMVLKELHVEAGGS